MIAAPRIISKTGGGLRLARIAFLSLAALLALAAATPATAAPKASNPSAILPGSNSKEPISIDADKLVYYDKEQKAIYSGNVVAIQGDSKLTCSMLTIFLARGEASKPEASSEKAPAASPASATGEAPSASPSQVKRMEAAGPVTVVSKTQVATGDRGIYDKTENKVWLLGNVTLSDGGNVTKGDKLTYDLTSGQAVVEVGHSTQRVHGQFIPSSNDNNGPDKSAPGKRKLPDNAAPKQ
jgi:lipopolysaccharide export system protein LptA